MGIQINKPHTHRALQEAIYLKFKGWRNFEGMQCVISHDPPIHYLFIEGKTVEKPISDYILETHSIEEIVKGFETDMREKLNEI